MFDQLVSQLGSRPRVKGSIGLRLHELNELGDPHPFDSSRYPQSRDLLEGESFGTKTAMKVTRRKAEWRWGKYHEHLSA